jgi:hypothetical protein
MDQMSQAIRVTAGKARLSLVMEGSDVHAREAPPATPAERVFAHWVFMLGKPASRTKMGPERRKVIDRALGLYEEDVLLLAVEGCAADRWYGGENDRGRPFNDIELILRNERNIERFAEAGEALRNRARQEAERHRQALHDAAESAGGEAPPAPTPEEVQAQRQALRELAARLAGRALK